MSEPFILMGLLVIACVICAPIALIIGIIALNRIKEIQGQLRRTGTEPALSERVRPKPSTPHEGQEVAEPVEPAKRVEDAGAESAVEGAVRQIKQQRTMASMRETLSLEQRIGTQWVLIAGVITVVFAVGFFLKYAYDNQWIGPLGRVIISAVAGLFALMLGEVTRRRGYGIVAKGVTALGFAILYATVFAAHRWYGLIDSAPAFVLAVCATGSAMLYAVGFDEIVAASLALIGGYVTPVVVSTGENLPTLLFGYVLILSCGALLCAFWRRWPAVNIAAFIGTFVLYTAWFEKFYRPVMKGADPAPAQMGVALFWLAVFFFLYLILPVLHELARKVISGKHTIWLILLNATVAFYYLWTILYGPSRTSLAACSAGLGAAHLALMAVAIVRCRDDVNLQHALLAIGLASLTVAVPLYLKMYAVVMAWAAKGVILTVIGLRYRSVLTKIAAAIVIALAVGRLVQLLPMHSAGFRPVFNTAFGTWCFVAAAIGACHVLYRMSPQVDEDLKRWVAQVSYVAAFMLLMAAVTMELWCHADLNFKRRVFSIFVKGMVPVFALFLLPFVTGPIPPRGRLCKIMAAVVAAAGPLYTVVAFTQFRNGSFVIFGNIDFSRALLLIAALFVGAWLLRRTESLEQTEPFFSVYLALAAILTLWVLLTEEIWYFWYCRNLFLHRTANWSFQALTYISIMWAAYAMALMVIGFWKKVRLMRYVALCMFVLLLAKIFLLDTRTVKSLYRIVGFMATGITLVGVSYLYQFLKKQGFFETVLGEKSTDE